MGCCKKAFDEEVYELEREKECMIEKVAPDVEDCLLALSEECVFSLVSFLSEKGEKFESLQKDIIIAVGIPENAERCENFLDETEKMEWKMCLHNQDKDLVWPCKLLRNVMKDTPLAKEACLQNFVECIANALPEPKVEEISLSCCKECVKNKTHFYELQEKCCMIQTKLDAVKCLNSLEKDCIPKIIHDFYKSKDAVKRVKKAVEEIVGVPPSVLHCKIHYKRTVDVVRGICIVNKDKNLDLFCSVVLHIYPSVEEL